MKRPAAYADRRFLLNAAPTAPVNAVRNPPIVRGDLPIDMAAPPE